MAIYDTMQFLSCDIQTICFGTAASMGAFLLSAGTKGMRKSLPNARIMIHQPLGGAQGQAADIEIQAKEILFVKALLNGYMAEFTGQPLEKIETDTDRDFFMTAEDAKVRKSVSLHVLNFWAFLVFCFFWCVIRCSAACALC